MSAGEPTGRRGPLLFVVAVFAASRALYFALGVRFDASRLESNFQFVDPVLLRERLLETLFFLHSQPPLFNLFIGLVLKLSPSGYGALFHASYLLLGLVLAVCLHRLMVALGVGPRLGAGLAALFVASPAAVLFENLLYYTYPIAVLLCLAALLLHRFVARRRLADGLLFFAVLATLALTRSIFHLVWLLLIAGALAAYLGRDARLALTAAAAPVLVVALLYGKNLVLFGSFTSSAWFGMQAARMTLQALEPAELERLASRGLISAVGTLGPFSEPELYRPFVDPPPPTGVPVLDRPRKASGAVNFHQLAYVAIARAYMRDATYVLVHRPDAYLRTVAAGLYITALPASNNYPLEPNRRRVEPLDRLYNLLANGQISALWPTDYDHGNLVRPGEAPLRFAWWIVLAYPAVLWLGARRLVFRGGAPPPEPAAAATLAFLCFNLLYVAAVAAALEIGENNRIRFDTDPLLVAGSGLLLERLRRGASQPRPAEV